MAHRKLRISISTCHRPAHQHTSTPGRTSLFCGASKTQDFDIDVSLTSTPAHQHTSRGHHFSVAYQKLRISISTCHQPAHQHISTRHHFSVAYRKRRISIRSKTQDFDITFLWRIENAGFRYVQKLRISIDDFDTPKDTPPGREYHIENKSENAG